MDLTWRLIFDRVNFTVDIRPTIAITKAHMKVQTCCWWSRDTLLTTFQLPELEDSVKKGRLFVALRSNSYPFIYWWLSRVPDGKVCLNEMGELAVTKFAVEPVRARKQSPTSSAITQRCFRFGIYLAWLRDLVSVRLLVTLLYYLLRKLIHFLDEGTLRRSLFEHTGGSYPEVCIRSSFTIA